MTGRGPKETWTIRKVRKDTVAAARKVTKTTTEQISSSCATLSVARRADSLLKFVEAGSVQSREDWHDLLPDPREPCGSGQFGF